MPLKEQIQRGRQCTGSRPKVFSSSMRVLQMNVAWSVGRSLERGCGGPFGHGTVSGRVEKAAKQSRYGLWRATTFGCLARLMYQSRQLKNEVDRVEMFIFPEIPGIGAVGLSKRGCSASPPS
jgi:hypothetical protein